MTDSIVIQGEDNTIHPRKFRCKHGHEWEDWYPLSVEIKDKRCQYVCWECIHNWLEQNVGAYEVDSRGAENRCLSG